MTSIEKETGKSFSVIDVAGAFEKMAACRLSDLRVEAEPATA